VEEKAEWNCLKTIIDVEPFTISYILWLIKLFYGHELYGTNGPLLRIDKSLNPADRGKIKQN